MQTLKVVKIGGNIIDNTTALNKFISDFAHLSGSKILVHGGGNSASDLSTQLGIKVNKVDGRRVTDENTLDVITMVYAGRINKSIVAKLQAESCQAIGLSGADGNAILSKKRPPYPVDFGFAGDVEEVNTTFIKMLLKEEIVPVFCALTHDKQGQLLNTNADTIASELAMALAEAYDTELYYCFEKKGVLTDVLDQNSVIEDLDSNFYRELKKKGQIADGMIPKLDNSFNALHQKVSKVSIGQPEMIFQPQSIFTTLKL